MRVIMTWAVALALVVAGVFAATCVMSTVPQSPEDALSRFYASNVAEDQLMDPLILAGSKVVPLVIREIGNKNAARRRYAIVALGHIGDRAGLGILETIFKDPAELDYFRCDALEAIALIDIKKARALAQEPGHLTEACSVVIKDILSGQALARRTYLDALLGVHE